jgi:hypothetical protein
LHRRICQGVDIVTGDAEKQDSDQFAAFIHDRVVCRQVGLAENNGLTDIKSFFHHVIIGRALRTQLGAYGALAIGLDDIGRDAGEVVSISYKDRGRNAEVLMQGIHQLKPACNRLALAVDQLPIR